ncbi:cilia- and flagella-associated protein 100 isoform X2 [Clinocottus analis]|uniref:cilia- and flagella-associated protein 100 isoform X2 n=1 Tax=Clinocottus analis TaxID=304258 RepID=UPI0035BFDB83
MASPPPDVRKRSETQQSPFKVPDSNSILLLSEKVTVELKEETRKLLALPIDKKMTHDARMTAQLRKEPGEEEEMKGMKNFKQIKSWTAPPRPTTVRHELLKAMKKRENIAKDSKHDLVAMERQKVVLELSLMEKRSEISKMDEAIAKEEKRHAHFEMYIEQDNLEFEEFLRENEKKSVEARTFFEREAKSKQEKNAKIKKLRAEIGAVTSELVKFEEILTGCSKYKELLFELSPPEWQEAQKAKAQKVPSDGDTKDKKESAKNSDSKSKAAGRGGELPTIREIRPGATLSTTPKLDSDNSEYEDESELFFTDPQQLLDLVTDLTEKNLSLIQNANRVEETVNELRKSLETTKKKIQKKRERLTLQINDMSQRIDVEKARGNKLNQMIQFHLSLNTEDQDTMWDALGEKVAEVYRRCVDDRLTNLSALDKLAHIENCMVLLLQGLENLPEESFLMVKKIKDSEKRSRQRDEKLREKQEKEKERMRKYSERSLANAKKMSGRKLMPRSKPVASRVKVKHVDNTPAEDEMYSYLFSADDTE